MQHPKGRSANHASCLLKNTLPGQGGRFFKSAHGAACRNGRGGSTFAKYKAGPKRKQWDSFYLLTKVFTFPRPLLDTGVYVNPKLEAALLEEAVSGQSLS